MRITALDLGASTGVCFGQSADKAPVFSTWNLRAVTLAERGRNLFEHLTQHVMTYEPDRIYVEAPLNMRTLGRIGSSDETLLSLHAYHGIALTVSALHGLDPQLIPVQVARRHFLGYRPKTKEGKKAVLARCQQLRWHPRNLNESDAAALWDYGVALEDSTVYLRERLRQSVKLSVA